MDSQDVKHKFDEAKYKVSKAVSDKESRYFSGTGAFYLGTLFLLFGANHVSNTYVNQELDTVTTDQTMQQYIQMEDALTALEASEELDQDAHKRFVDNLLILDDLSEEQSQELLTKYEDVFGETENTVGYEIGSIDDLREVRAALGDGASAEQIAAGTVEEQDFEDMYGYAHGAVWWTMVLLLGGALLGSIPGVRRIADKGKPRHPRFKH